MIFLETKLTETAIVMPFGGLCCYYYIFIVIIQLFHSSTVAKNILPQKSFERFLLHWHPFGFLKMPKQVCYV
jgi:hypothetical protein